MPAPVRTRGEDLRQRGPYPRSTATRSAYRSDALEAHCTTERRGQRRQHEHDVVAEPREQPHAEDADQQEPQHELDHEPDDWLPRHPAVMALPITRAGIDSP